MEARVTWTQSKIVFTIKEIEKKCLLDKIE